MRDLLKVPPSSFLSLNSAKYQRLVGRVVWLCLSRRPLFAALRVAVHPDSVSDSRCRLLAADELHKIARLSCLGRIALKRPLSYIVLCTDASPWRGSVMWAVASQAELDSLLSTSRYVGGELPDPSPALDFASNRRWRLVCNPLWRTERHINELEGSAALLALKWFVARGNHSTRVVWLSDSFVTIAAVRRGRSSATGMLRFARVFGALALAHDVEVLPVHLPGRANPANAPSRVPRH